MLLLLALSFFQLRCSWRAGSFLDEFAAGGNTVREVSFRSRYPCIICIMDDFESPSTVITHIG